MPNYLKVAVVAVFLLLGCASSGTHIHPEATLSAPQKEVYASEVVKPKPQNKVNKSKALFLWSVIASLIVIAAYSSRPVAFRRKKKPIRKK